MQLQHLQSQKTITNDRDSSMNEHQRNNGMKHNNGAFGGIYGLAFVGAAVYSIQHSATFWERCTWIFQGPCVACHPDVQIARVSQNVKINFIETFLSRSN